ncbi:hypothetical protein P152DRAFT_512462 [Eremomyces bilateralis CBS 781.70]|uniref:Uncharacterized protein n=1 Tax=Eremomyces bilateralis CBS 781.70 TaxID=1392243 RepID=A0A6G1GB72_9PEZI|nr:uncharacterized protein P152DRAFT_512462 [Eremomyces bilateralis CBS 781.70]KAF1815186.1 hypothetical protein P152DRAFT_512462 [Eremomyces bilateralis CBS 781.70]
MTDLEIGNPSVLARFASPVAQDQQPDHASPVYHLKGTRKRQRDEILVPVDGSGLHIYDIKQPRLVTTYPVAPQTRFLTKPSSICKKTSDATQPLRFTYAFIETKIGVPSYEVVCYTEATSPAGETKRYSYPHHATRPEEMVVAIEVAMGSEYYSPGMLDHFVLLIQSDGTVVCLSADLSSLQWKFKPKGETSATRAQDVDGFKAEFACLCNFQNVEAGLLNGRQDLVAQIRDHSTKRRGEPQILCTLLSDADQSNSSQVRHRLSICAIWLEEHGSAIVEIDCWDLPFSSNPEDCRQWFLDDARGKIVCGDGRRVSVIDISGTVPRISATFENYSLPIRSFICLGHSHLIFLSSHSVGVLDMTYQSVLSSTPIAAGSESSFSGLKKRKRGAMNNTWGSFRLILYSAKSNLAVGVADGELISFSISKGESSAARSLRDSTLLDSLAKGPQRTGVSVQAPLSQRISSLDAELPRSSSKVTASWEKERQALERASDAGNVEEFENILARGLNIPVRELDVESHPSKPSKRSKTTSTSDSASRSGSQWDFEAIGRDQMLRAHPEKAEYALAKIFAWNGAMDQATSSKSADSEEKGQLTILFLPKNVLQWLVLSAHFSLSMLNRALAASSSENARPATSRDLVSSFIRYDPEMRLLRELLFLHRYLDAPTVVEAVRAVIRSLRTEDHGFHTTTESNDDTADGKKDHDEALLDLEVEEASRDLDLALATLEHGEAIRGQTLWQALTILHSFPSTTIVATLRDSLTTQEIIFLIQLLRIELAHGGWTSRFMYDSASTSLQSDLSDRAILLIVNLISCAVDAVNIAGWQSEAAVRAAAEDEEGGLPLSLRTDVSAALEGIHEAVFLKSLLGDFRRYSLGVKKSYDDGYAQYLPGDTSLLALEGLDRYGFGRNESKAPGTNAAKPIGTLDQSMEAKMLPLGCKFDHIARLRKVADGVTKGKSRRQLGQEISRRVGPYSFEKVRF